MNEINSIIDAVVSGDIDTTKGLVKIGLGKGFKPIEIINKGLVSALDVVGERFANGQLFLPEMILSAIAAREGIAIATNGMQEGAYQPKATMVLGTVKGDLHDIGKNLVALFLRGKGFDVIDLGIDVSEEQFVKAVQEIKPQILGMSCLMITTMTRMKDVIDALTEAELRNEVKVIIGGCPVSEEFALQIGADYYGRDAGITATILERMLEKKTK